MGTFVTLGALLVVVVLFFVIRDAIRDTQAKEAEDRARLLRQQQAYATIVDARQESIRINKDAGKTTKPRISKPARSSSSSSRPISDDYTSPTSYYTSATCSSSFSNVGSSDGYNSGGSCSSGGDSGGGGGGGD